MGSCRTTYAAYDSQMRGYLLQRTRERSYADTVPRYLRWWGEDAAAWGELGRPEAAPTWSPVPTSAPAASPLRKSR